jgi:membrane fusion protein (multidrug efflux system)
MRIPWYGEILALGLWLVVATGCGESSNADSGGSTTTATPAAQTQTQTPATEKDNEGPPEDAIAIEVGSVQRGSLSSLYSTSATLRADKRATVTARTQGVIRELLVEEGDWVEEGQPLAVLEDDEQAIAFEQARANADNQRREAERAETLHSQSLLSQEEYEVARREAVDSKHVAELAELTLSRTVIRATFSGQVLTRHLDVGATVGDGTPVYDIADLDPLYADVQVPERQVAELAPDQMVRLTTESNGDSVDAAARIERIAPAVDPSTGTVKVTVAVHDTEGLRPGSFVRVGIVTDTHDNALVVPRSALVAEGRRWHLFRIREDNEYQVELIEVTRGFEEAERVEILETAELERPLDEGDPVVVTGASSLSDESNVKVLDDEPAADAEELADADEEDGDQSKNGSDEEQGVAA